MTVKTSMFRLASVAALGLTLVAAGCGEYVRNSGRAPAQPIIVSLQGASGATPDQFGNPLVSDVVTNVTRTVNGQQLVSPTVFNDVGQVTMGLILKDPGTAGLASAPSDLNQITFTRYRVVYRRSDGRNTPGVDVPFPLDSAVTFTVPPAQNVTASFELVRNDAKNEAPLRALRFSPVIITTIADVTFYGRDQAGNDVATTGSIQINFGDFGDPQ